MLRGVCVWQCSRLDVLVWAAVTGGMMWASVREQTRDGCCVVCAAVQQLLLRANFVHDPHQHHHHHHFAVVRVPCSVLPVVHTRSDFLVLVHITHACLHACPAAGSRRAAGRGAGAHPAALPHTPPCARAHRGGSTARCLERGGAGGCVCVGGATPLVAAAAEQQQKNGTCTPWLWQARRDVARRGAGTTTGRQRPTPE